MEENRPVNRKAEMRRKKRKRSLITKFIILIVLIVVLIVALVFLFGKKKPDTPVEPPVTTSSSVSTSSSSVSTGSTSSSSEAAPTDEPVVTQEPGQQAGARENMIATAAFQASQYDYDAAIATLYSIEGADRDPEIISLLADYETARSNLVAISPYEVTHVFFHSLVVDPSRGFSVTDSESWNNATAGFCQWMTTVDEFNAMMQQMYDRGYVLISLYDMIDETPDENGYVHITPKNIYLPQGKTPFVLSLDDLSYYHSYDGRGCATRMIVGENGKPTCEYVTADGTTLVGSYDCVPLLDDFIAAHPDFSYKGAKGTIALTGYNGIFGYRTDYCYRDRVELTPDQEAWLAVHPEYSWENECAQARAVADALRADGWTFASHTWGHIRVGSADLGWIQTDTQKWKEYVEPLIGPTDIIIFAHGEDLANWHQDAYAASEKFQYLKSVGFNIFCNVDSSQLFVQIDDGFLRMGRRNLDGLRLWYAVYGGNDKLSDLFDPATVIDPNRPVDSWLYE